MSLDISINESSLDSGAFVVGALIVGISTLCVLSWSMCGALAGTQGLSGAIHCHSAGIPFL